MLPDRVPQRLGRWALPAGVVLAGLAMAAQLVLNQAVATIGHLQGKDWTIFTPGYDFQPIWLSDHFLLFGSGDRHWYGPGFSNALSPWLLGPDPGLILNFVSFICYALVLLAYSLLRIPPEADASSAGPCPADDHVRVA